MHIHIRCGRRALVQGPHTPCRIGLYKIFFSCEAVVHESTICSPPRPPALPTRVQYYCTIIGQYTTPPPNSRLYAMHHIILVITISFKGQVPKEVLYIRTWIYVNFHREFDCCAHETTNIYVHVYTHIGLTQGLWTKDLVRWWRCLPPKDTSPHQDSTG